MFTKGSKERIISSLIFSSQGGHVMIHFGRRADAIWTISYWILLYIVKIKKIKIKSIN